MASADVQMLQGVVAMIDALGFKGIWGDVNKPSTDVLRSLRRIGRAAKLDAGEASLRLQSPALPAELTRFIKEPEVSVVQLSDTIVVAAGRRGRFRAIWKRHAAQLEKMGLNAPWLDRAVDGYLRYLVCRCVCRVLKVAALCEPTVAYRGVITAGKFVIKKNLLLGPAVDEAAELMNLADGPFVWLAPTAGRLPNDFHNETDHDWNRLTLDYRLPLKSGQRLPARVLNPFALCNATEQKKAQRNLLRQMDSTRIDVVVKRGNAVLLFKEIRRAAERAAMVAKYREKAKEKAAAKAAA
jgi:hypothetical protein